MGLGLIVIFSVDSLYYNIILVTEPWMLCTDDMYRMGDLYIWGEGKKFYVLTKHVEKNTFLFSLGIFQWLIKSEG